jgi:hypothetical protein
MRVDEGWGDHLPGNVDPFVRGRILSDPGDPAIDDGDIGPLDLPGKDVHDLAAGHNEIGRLLSQRDR